MDRTLGYCRRDLEGKRKENKNELRGGRYLSPLDSPFVHVYICGSADGKTGGIAVAPDVKLIVFSIFVREALLSGLMIRGYKCLIHSL